MEPVGEIIPLDYRAWKTNFTFGIERVTSTSISEVKMWIEPGLRPKKEASMAARNVTKTI